MFEVPLEEWNPDCGYSGPTDLGFDHPEFLNSQSVHQREREVTDLLNKLEKFATATGLILRSPVLYNLEKRLQLERQTSESFLNIVNTNFDVICYHMVRNSQIYPAIRKLYSAWDSHYAWQKRDDYFYMSSRRVFLSFNCYRIIVGDDYHDYADAASSVVTIGESCMKGLEEVRITVQAIDKVSKGVAGWPVLVSVDGGEIVERKEWYSSVRGLHGLCLKLKAFVLPPRHVSMGEYVSNSSGTVVLVIRKTVGAGDMTIRADVPYTALPLIKNNVH
ncbi:hypothetical protein [Alicyclobacillus sp. ALC3]|uniref:hypothetical protein n=1 Tax=Alicyclobacillus sp. ALC3 TaxID=2796143 RepID=UPI00237859D8|nr:hypothetical protein [Alicyclobacillus sp. ALC3]WDL99793.1 hypothetical protein JC200_23775 [Alicyclobacillus sp. ALC3]